MRFAPGKKPRWDVGFFSSQNLSYCGADSSQRRVLADGGIEIEIPHQLADYPLIRVCPPDDPGIVHQSCSSPGKQPCTSTKDHEQIKEIESWLENGGNVGVVPTSENDLVIVDVDMEVADDRISQHLPETFTVRTGSGNPVYYYRCTDFSTNKSFKVNDTEYGSIRSDYWHAAIPPSRHESGGRYTVAIDEPITEIDEKTVDRVIAEFEELTEGVEDVNDVKRGGGGGAAPPGAPRSSHSNSQNNGSSAVNHLDFVKRDDLREELAEILDSSSPAHSRRIWLVGWLYSAAGLPADEITDLILEAASWKKLDRETTRQQVESVIASSDSDRGTHYSEYDSATAYKPSGDSEDGERRKKESGVRAPDTTEVTTMSSNNDVNYSDKEEALVQEGSEDGDSFKKVVRVVREEGDETNEFIALKKGRVEEMTTMDGQEVLVQNVSGSNSLGSPEYIDDLIDGLEELQEKMNGEKAAADD